MNKKDEYLRTKEMLLPRSHKNIVHLHNGKETPGHPACKALVCKRLKDLKKTFYTEVEVGNGVADIYIPSENVAIEIETNMIKTDWRRKEDQLGCTVLLIDPDTIAEWNPIYTRIKEVLF